MKKFYIFLIIFLVGCSGKYSMPLEHLYKTQDEMYLEGYRQAVDDCEHRGMGACKGILSQMDYDIKQP